MLFLDHENNKTQEGSSFESASSLYSSTRTENIAEDLIVPSFSPPLQINEDFIVPDLASPPLPIPDRIPKASLEKIEVKAEIVSMRNHSKREKTESKPKEDTTKTSKVLLICIVVGIYMGVARGGSCPPTRSPGPTAAIK